MKNLFQSWVEKSWWWLPTKDDQIKYKEEELKRIQQEYPNILSKILALSEERIEIENTLVATMSIEQHEIFLKLKVAAQKEVFEAGRIKYFDERLKELSQ